MLQTSMTVHPVSVRMEGHVMMASVVTAVTVSLASLAATVKLVSTMIKSLSGSLPVFKLPCLGKH